MTSTTKKRSLCLAMLCGVAFTAHHLGALAAFWLAFLCLAVLAGGQKAMCTGQLGAAPDTNDVASALNLDEILNAAITSFRRAILPLTMFSTTFRNVQLQGTNVVQVPYYPLQTAASKNFSGTYNTGTGGGSKTDTRPVTINKRKYQILSLTGAELARTPYLNATKLGQMKGEALAYDIIQDVLSVVTAAHYPGVAFTGAASGFDSDDVVDIRTSCEKNAAGASSVTDGVTTNASKNISSATANFTDNDIGITISGTGIAANTTIASVTDASNAVLSANATADGTGITFTLGRRITPWPQTGRGLIVTPDYDGALLKDTNFKAAYAIGSTDPIREGQLPRVFGFDYASSAAIPTNGENLVGMATYMSAILFAQSPIPPPAAVRQLMTQYEIVDDPLGTGISLEYRVWGDPNSDTENRVIEANYGYGPGEGEAIKRIKSA